MDRDPGRLQRAIIELIESSGSEDVGWTTSWLCKHVYGGKSSKSQRSALMRAIKTMKLPLGWKFERGWDELQLINDERFYARRRSRHEGVRSLRRSTIEMFSASQLYACNSQRARRGVIFVEISSI